MDSDNLILVLNVGACLLLATLASWAVLDERIHEGVIVRAGLILVALGFAGIAIALLHGDGLLTLQRAMGLLHAGIIVVLLGREWRAHRRHQPMRRRSDWIDLEDAQRMAVRSRSRWRLW